MFLGSFPLIGEDTDLVSLNCGRLAKGVVTRAVSQWISESQWNIKTASPLVEPAKIIGSQKSEFYY